MTDTTTPTRVDLIDFTLPCQMERRSVAEAVLGAGSTMLTVGPHLWSTAGWATDDRYDSRWDCWIDQICTGNPIVLTDTGGEYVDDTPFTLDAIITAVRERLGGGHLIWHASSSGELDIDIDAGDADVILQLAAWGQVVLA